MSGWRAAVALGAWVLAGSALSPALAGKPGKRAEVGVEQVARLNPPSARLASAEIVQQRPGWRSSLPDLLSDPSLDLRSLARVQLSFSLDVPDPGFATLTAEAREALIRHLQADPRWRVTSEAGVLLAIRRHPQGAAWTSEFDGVRRSSTGACRLALRFAPLPSQHPWASAGWVQRARFGEGVVEMTAVPWELAPVGPVVVTALSLTGGGVWLDLVEAAGPAGRPCSVETLDTIGLELSQVIAGYDLVGAQGFVPFAMPPGEPTGGAAVTLSVEPGGWLEVRARVAPGSAGWTWLRLMHAGAPWSEELVAAGTRERVGDGPAAGGAFWLQGRFAAPVPPSGLRAELWHLGDGEATPRRVWEGEPRVGVAGAAGAASGQ